MEAKEHRLSAQGDISTASIRRTVVTRVNIASLNLEGVESFDEHDSGACIYGALVSVYTNDIFSKNEFLILDVGRKIISKDNVFKSSNEQPFEKTHCNTPISGLRSGN
ncbi:hypothetical protein Tco_0935419 [Tanacetum coccineum]